MQWSNGLFPQSQNTYGASTEMPPVSDAQILGENQEFSLASIQERLGSFTATEEREIQGSSDIMPSSQTLNMSYQREYANYSEKTVSKTSTKTKVLVASYVVVVLALVLAVSLCAVNVSGAFSSAIVLDQQYAQAVETANQLEALTQVENYSEMVQKATNLGFVDVSASTTQSYTGLATRPAQNFAVESNWFDSLCDWLCNIIGD